MMNAEQQAALDRFKSGVNIMLTGSAGVGKSYLLKHIIDWCRTSKIPCGVTATTGSAAILIGGRTLHSFLGIGLASKSAAELANTVIRKNKQVTTKLRSLNVLVIDEISMLDAELLDKISEFIGLIRNDTKPFGGLQLVLCGDFCQLPPVNGKYCFLSNTWKYLHIQKCELTQLMRQNDDEFKEILESVRWGKCSVSILSKLKELKNTTFDDEITPTILYSMNRDVDRINENKMKELVDAGAPTVVYTTKYSKLPSSKAWADSSKIPETVELCVGAQVVMTWNIDQDSGLVNGSRGVVKSFTPIGPIVKFLSGEKLVETFNLKHEDDISLFVQFMPLKLAFASTCHKSQGMTLDCVEMDLGQSIFAYGQAYTALSRARNLASVRIIDVKASSFKTDPAVLKFYGQ